ncbi:hypothetical protein FRC07_011351 [Ceratobasidium sp. 392]|nr:hypothetical protein FRC07_011351 [Ceratobasidium sp. 392]
MNAHSIRHAWFPPTIPKRKISLTELDTESEWPSAFRALSGPAHAPRPAKRIKALEGGLAGLKLDMGAGMNGWKTNVEPSPEEVMQEEQQEPNAGSQIHETHFSSEAEPYISSIYEYASPYPTTTGSSVVSLPLRGEVSEASASDEERDQKEREMVGRETVVNVQAQRGLPGYVVYEPEAGTEKRKSRGEEDEMEMEERDSKAGKKKWFEPEKDRTSPFSPSIFRTN